MKSKIQVLLSAMNIENEEQYKKLLKQNKITGNVITVNQVDNKEDIFQIENGMQKIYSYQEKGVSKSRNKLLEKLSKEIGILADDDTIYCQNYENIIEEEYAKNPKADVIIFFVENQNPNREKIKKIGNKKLRAFDVMRVRTCEVTFKKESLKKVNAKFDNTFGPGGVFSKGEETVFVSDLLKSGLKIYSTTKKIAEVRDEKSTWFTGFNEKFLYDQGAIFYRIEPKLYKLLIIQYVIRKHSLYKNNLSIWNAYKQMKNGAKKCKKEKSEGKYG